MEWHAFFIWSHFDRYSLTQSLTHSLVLWWQKNHPSIVRSGEFGINRPMSPVSSLSPWEILASLLHPASRGRTLLSSMRDIVAPLNYFSLLIIKIISHVPILPLPLIALVLILVSPLSFFNEAAVEITFFFNFWNKDEERNSRLSYGIASISPPHSLSSFTQSDW